MTALHWTETLGPQLLANWKSGKHNSACGCAKWFQWNSDASC